MTNVKFRLFNRFLSSQFDVIFLGLKLRLVLRKFENPCHMTASNCSEIPLKSHRITLTTSKLQIERDKNCIE